MNNSEETQAEVDLDLPLEFRGVAAKYGRKMFTLVFNAGMSSQAAQVLMNFAEKHRSQHSLSALEILVSSFNEVSNDYCKLQGWDEGMIAQCDRDIRLAFKHKIITPQDKIILDS